jgi:hypothetical protein
VSVIVSFFAVEYCICRPVLENSTIRMALKSKNNTFLLKSNKTDINIKIITLLYY